MPFFDQPGSSAGPYSTPPQQGIFSKIMQGVNVALKLGDFYQDWQTKSQAQKTGAMQQFASKLGIQKALAGEGQPVDMSTLGPEAEGMGFKVPRVTPESQVGMAGNIMQTTAGMPVTESRPGLTTPGDPGVAARDAAQVKGMAAIPEVGGYAPLMPSQQTVAVVGKGGMTSQFKVPAGAKIVTDPGARTRGTEVWDDDGNVVGYTDRNVKQLRPSQEVLQDRQIAVKTAVPGRAPGGASGGGGGGRPETLNEARLFERALEEYRKEPGQEKTSRVDFGPIYAASRRPGYNKTTTKPNFRTTTTEMTPKGGPSAAGPKPSGTQVIPPSAYGGKYYSEGDSHFQWDGAKYVPYTGK